MANKEGITFVDLDELFILRNGSVNKPLLYHDGPHLSKHGLNCLIQACDVKLKQGCDSAYNDVRPEQNSPIYFRGHTPPLSNFYALKDYAVDGIHFATSEAAYVYRKALYHNDYHTAAEVRHSQTGIHAKRLGDKIVTKDTWQNVKVDIKLASSEEVKNAHLAADERDIIEDTNHTFWGHGTNNGGQNMLGKNVGYVQEKAENWENKIKESSKEDLHLFRRQWATRQSQPKCYRCGEPGHL